MGRVLSADGVEKNPPSNATAHNADGTPKSSGSTTGAPSNAAYVVTSTHANLTNEDVATSSTSVIVALSGITVEWERAALTGDVTASQNDNATTIANNTVSDAKLRDSSGYSVIGKASTGSGDPADIVAADETVLGRTGGGNVAFAQVATGQIASDAVTFAKMQNIATDSLIGRDTAGTGDPENITLDSTLEMTGAGVLRVAAGASGAARIPHFDNPPSSPSAYNDEFTAGTLDAKWTVDAGPTAAAVDPLATLSAAQRYDLTTWPSYLLFQGHDAATTGYGFRQSITIDTNATLFFKMVIQQRGATNGAAHIGADEASAYVYFDNSGDTNEQVVFGLRTSGSGATQRFYVNNNAVNTKIDAGSGAQILYGAIYKVSNAYYAYAFSIDGAMTYLGTQTKTGVTTLDRINIQFNTSNDTITPIIGVDFVRYYATNTFALRNT